jgi:hypothetical protein
MTHWTRVAKPDVGLAIYGFPKPETELSGYSNGALPTFEEIEFVPGDPSLRLRKEIPQILLVDL